MTHLAAIVPDDQRASASPQYDARDLTNSEGVAHIKLDGQLYTLRITRQGKLILTK